MSQKLDSIFVSQIWEEVEAEVAVAAKEAEKNLPEFEVFDSDIYGNRTSGKSYVLRGLCGFAWVRIRPARGKMVTWLKKNNIGSTDHYRGGYTLWVGSDINVGSTQSVDVKYAAAKAACAVFSKYGIRAYPESRLD